MTRTQIIIPMAGKSQRFYDQGYTKPKGLIEFHGLSMIGHILKVFKNFDDIVLISNTKDAKEFELEKYVSNLHPNAIVAGIDPHNLGPSYSILQAEKKISKNKKIIVHYCDFSGIWEPLETEALLDNHDGVFVAFKGFHPSKINKTKFAYGKTDNENTLLEIKEKGSFTTDPEKEYASSGIYGFASGDLLLESISEQVSLNLQINGEFYTSLTQEVMLRKDRKIVVQAMESFFAWGTPEDLESYIYFKDSCSHLKKVNTINNPVIDHSGIVLAAGKSSRLKLNNETPKQLKNVLGDSVLEYSRKLIDGTSNTYLVATSRIYQNNFWDLPEGNMSILSHATESQLASVQIGISLLKNKNDLITFLASDNLILFEKSFKIREFFVNTDLLVWTSANYPVAQVQPEQYSWVKVNDENIVEDVIYKSSPFDLKNWKIMTGNFSFSSSILLNKLIEKLDEKCNKLNREPILDDLIGVALAMDLTVKALDVPYFITLGTEMENSTFDYYFNSFKAK
jgi:bifunctional N-acetylglucosamine-1-phosphate-uridyltransferase/glucosamine-1-phosphate-acetyltransferase GlmU-like protein